MIILRAAFKPRAYRQLVQRPFSRACLYLALLVILAHLPYSLSTWAQVRQAREGMEALLREVPPFRIRDGLLDLQLDEPLVVEPAPGQILIIDPQGEVSEDVLAGYERGMLIGARKMVYRDATVYHTVRFSSLEGLAHRDHELNSLTAWYPAAAIAHHLWFLGAAYIRQLLGALLVAALVFSVVRIQRRRAYFPTLWKASVYALTLPSLVTAGLGALAIETGVWWPLFWAVGLAYVFLALPHLESPPEGG